MSIKNEWTCKCGTNNTDNFCYNCRKEITFDNLRSIKMYEMIDDIHSQVELLSELDLLRCQLEEMSIQIKGLDEKIQNNNNLI